MSLLSPRLTANGLGVHENGVSLGLLRHSVQFDKPFAQLAKVSLSGRQATETALPPFCHHICAAHRLVTIDVSSESICITFKPGLEVVLQTSHMLQNSSISIRDRTISIRACPPRFRAYIGVRAKQPAIFAQTKCYSRCAVQ
eukprot:3053432-Amphidinium_carterae.1